MDCPQCTSDDVEYEPCRVVDLFDNQYPAALYQCNNCGCDFQWIRNRGITIISDGVEGVL